MTKGAGIDAGLAELLRAIASGDTAHAVRILDTSPALATAPVSVGASAEAADGCFLTEIRHYFYAGDTALHIAAARVGRAASGARSRSSRYCWNTARSRRTWMGAAGAWVGRPPPRGLSRRSTLALHSKVLYYVE